MAASNEKVLLIPQCETLEALENIEEIVKIEGIDGIFIGPYDLSICMGIPTQFDHPDFKAAVERIRKACRESGKLCMIYTTTIEEARKWCQVFVNWYRYENHHSGIQGRNGRLSCLVHME